MGLNKITLKHVLLLAMLIAFSSSIPIDQKDSTTAPEISQSKEDKITRYRLPNNTIPRLYNIFIEPNMDDEIFSWSGSISIDIEVIDPTSLLTLHAFKNLLIDEKFTALIDADGTKLTPLNHSRDVEVEFLILQFNHEVPIGNYSLNLKYKGVEVDKSGGFFRSSHRSESRTVAGTLFEATAARRAFPCWDEPAFKAQFNVSIKHFSNYTAISNMQEIKHVGTPDGKILTNFNTTLVMSTYLLTFVISDYENLFNEYRNVSVHASKDVLEKAKYILDISPKIVKVMENYTGFPYGFPRIGSVLLPVLTSTAVEHWGLVTYREKAVIFDAALNTTEEKCWADMVIAHELAHSWFGNRVTQLWWSEIWINEAFAAYFQYYILNEIYENNDVMQLFILKNNQLTFTIDTGDKMPLKWTPTTNEEIKHIFDDITYQKGAAIIHMFRNVLSDNVFRSGIQTFMTKYSFKAATVDEFIAAFQEAYDNDSNKNQKALDLKDVMTPWLVQKGYPIINVARNYTTGVAEVSQKSSLVGDNFNKWWVPLTYTTKSSLNFSSTSPASWISNTEGHVKIGQIKKNDWIILDVQASGYYRVNYDDENWNRLADYLNTDNYQNIHVLNRARLINDAFYLAQHEPNRYFRNFFKLTKYLSREVDYLPWSSAKDAIIHIEYWLRHTKMYEIFVKWILELMNGIIKKVGFEVRNSDDQFTKLARINIISMACQFGHSECSEWAAQRVIKLVQDPVKYRLHPDIRNWIFCAGLRGINDTAVKLFADWAYDHERDELIESVGCTENHKIHRNILNDLLTKPVDVRSFEMVFNKLLESTDENFTFAVDFFEVMIKSGNFKRLFNTSTMVHGICDQVKTRAQAEKLKQLLNVIRRDRTISKKSIMTAAKLNVAEADDSADFFSEVMGQRIVS